MSPVPAPQASGGAPVLPTGVATLRAGQHADHQQPAGWRVGAGVRRRRRRHRHPRSAAASQPGHHDPGRQLPAARQAPQRPSAEGRCPHPDHVGELINPGGAIPDVVRGGGKSSCPLTGRSGRFEATGALAEKWMPILDTWRLQDGLG